VDGPFYFTDVTQGATHFRVISDETSKF